MAELRVGGERTVVLIDAANVLHADARLAGPRELVDRAVSWAAAAGLDAWIVWDGAPDGAGAERTIGTSRVLLGRGESADTVLERLARERAAAGHAYWLVSSDRVVRSVAGAGAERMIQASTFAQVLVEGPDREDAPDASGREGAEPPHPLGSLLDPALRAALERLRRGE